MSKINIVSNLYLGSNELNNFVEFVSDKKFFKIIMKTHGISLKNENSLKVVNNTGTNSVSLLSGEAIDKDLNIIQIESTIENFLTLNNGEEKLITIQYSTTHLEKGKVSITKDGKITGIGTNFLRVLRGVPINPTRIKFPNSTINLGDYEILSVDSDNIAFLNSLDFTEENNLEWSVVGCFTPGIALRESVKQIYEYDSYKINSKSLLESISDKEIKLAIVKNNNNVITITDLRGQNKLSLIQ